MDFKQRRTIQLRIPPAYGDNPPENTIYEWFEPAGGNAICLVCRFPDSSEKRVCGILGASGVEGVSGPKLGQTGASGATGLDGATGVYGHTGVSGAAGATGPIGVHGVFVPKPIRCENFDSIVVPPFAVVEAYASAERIYTTNWPSGPGKTEYVILISRPTGMLNRCIFVNGPVYGGTPDIGPPGPFMASDGSGNSIKLLISSNGLPEEFDIMNLPPGIEFGPNMNSWEARAGYPSIATLLHVETPGPYPGDGAVLFAGQRMKGDDDRTWLVLTGGTTAGSDPSIHTPPNTSGTWGDGSVIWQRHEAVVAYVIYHPLWNGPRCQAVVTDDVFKDTEYFDVTSVTTKDGSMTPTFNDQSATMRVENPQYDQYKGFCFDVGDTIYIEPYIDRGEFLPGATGIQPVQLGALKWKPCDGPCGTPEIPD